MQANTGVRLWGNSTPCRLANAVVACGHFVFVSLSAGWTSELSLLGNTPFASLFTFFFKIIEGSFTVLCQFLPCSIVTRPHIGTFFFSYYLPSCSVPESPMLYSRTSLPIHLKCNSLQLFIDHPLWAKHGKQTSQVCCSHGARVLESTSRIGGRDDLCPLDPRKSWRNPNTWAW